MAEAFARWYGLQAFSAGTSPSGKIHPYAVQVMAEKGIDLDQQRSKGLNEVDLQRFDFIITLGCCSVETLPLEHFQGEKLNWELEDPAGKAVGEFRKTRDEIEARVKQLIDRISNRK